MRRVYLGVVKREQTVPLSISVKDSNFFHTCFCRDGGRRAIFFRLSGDFVFFAFTASLDSDWLVALVPVDVPLEIVICLFGVGGRAAIFRLAAVGAFGFFAVAPFFTIAGSDSEVDEASDFEILLLEDLVGWRAREADVLLARVRFPVGFDFCFTIVRMQSGRHRPLVRRE